VVVPHYLPGLRALLIHLLMPARRALTEKTVSEVMADETAGKKAKVKAKGVILRTHVGQRGD